MKLADRSIDLDRFMGLFKGPPGSGKSIAAASFPKPMYIFDLDGRVASIRNYYNDDFDSLKEIHYDTYTDYAKFAMKLEGLQKTNPYKTVVIDGLTNLSRMVLRFIMKIKGGGKSLIIPTGSTGRNVAGIAIPSIEDYLGESQALRECLEVSKIISGIHKCNIIWTAHVIRTEERKLSGSVTVHRSLLTGGHKVAAALPGEFDEIYHFDTQAALSLSKRPSYIFYTHNTSDDFAKTALPLPVRIDVTRKDLDSPITAENGHAYNKLISLVERKGIKVK